MAITLETVAAPGATPIAHNSASAKSFANDYARVGPGCLSTQDRKTILILCMVYILANSGANYKANHAGLIQDAAVYTSGISMFDWWSAIIGPSYTGAVAVDPSLSSDVNTLLKEGRDLANLPEETLDRILGFLVAQLGL